MIFNGEMVRAILGGRKTQTRRPVNPSTANLLDLQTQYPHKKYNISCPFGAVGDRIWVRETWNKYGGLLTYRADYDWIEDMKKEMACHESYPKWHPSIHMPRWASRLTLEITGVRVERLASISDDDAGKEGYPANPAPYGGNMDKWLWFRQLWDSIYPDQSFKHNPWSG